MRSSALMRGVFALIAPSIVPSWVSRPARYISAKASMMPDPQIPVTPVPSIVSAKPTSFDHSSLPITRNRGSSVSGSMRRRSMAPGAARWPQEICAPSKAGPVGDDAAKSRSLLPITISALVPTSAISMISSERCGPSERITPAVSAPTWPAIQGRT